MSLNKGNFVILILTRDKAKGDGPDKPVSLTHERERQYRSEERRVGKEC